MPHNDSPSDKFIQEMYQQASKGTAPAALDQAILAAAKESTQATALGINDKAEDANTDAKNADQNTPNNVVPLRGLNRWSTPLAAAASLMLCVSLILNVVQLNQQSLSFTEALEINDIGNQKLRETPLPSVAFTDKKLSAFEQKTPSPLLEKETSDNRLRKSSPAQKTASHAPVKQRLSSMSASPAPQQLNDPFAAKLAEQQQAANDTAMESDLSNELSELGEPISNSPHPIEDEASLEEFADTHPKEVEQIIVLLKQQRYLEAKQLLDLLVKEKEQQN